ncbi:sialidase-3-like isoform X2 [Dendrobates tinctorius]|uniref:sialidase-3-like isoform X2 n=1 Tax=Dendrobates tinctorius TaxID=92724 RepID=UPI003CC99252
MQSSSVRPRGGRLPPKDSVRGWRIVIATMKASQPERTPLFKKESNGCVYRTPALLYIPAENMFLAFAEKRESDAEVDSLVMRRGIYKTGYVSEG